MWLIIVWNRVPSVKVCHGQKWIIYVICWYSFVLHPKMFAPCASPSTIIHVCLISLMLCVNSCMTCGIWYVVCSVLYATCLNSLNICLFCYVPCMNQFMLCLKILCQFFYIQFDTLDLQDGGFVLKIICGLNKIISSIGRFTFWPLVIVIIESVLDMNLAYDHSFMKYPMY